MRPRLAFAAPAVVLLLLTACGSGDPGKPDQPAPTGTSAGEPTASTTEQLTVSIGGDEGTLTPYTYVTGFPGWNLLNLVYDTLLGLDPENVAQPLLASDYEVSDDGLTYTLTITDGVTWHDGEPMTADDVAFTLDYFAKNQASRFTPQLGGVVDVAVEGGTVTITLDAANPDFIIRPLADMPIIPEHIWSTITDPKTATAEQAIGTGPYRLVGYEAEQSYAFGANESYAFGTTTVETLDVAIIPEDQTAFAALQSGEIDAIGTGASPNLADQASGDDELAIAEGPEFASTILLLNNEIAPFDRPEVRLAIAAAIDLQELVDVVRLGRATPGSSGYVHPDVPASAGLPPHEFDPQAAAIALDQLGAAAGADGTRVLDGTPMAFDLLVSSDSPDRIRSAEIISEELAEIGIAVTVQPLDPDSVDAQVWPDFDVANGRDFDMAMWGWSAPTMLDSARIASLVIADPETGSLNVQGTDDPELTQLGEAVLAAATPEDRLAAVAELQDGMASVVPFVPLYYEDGLYPYRPEAYDGWVFQLGQGILQKLSFVER